MHGALAGPLGPATLDGLAAEGKLAARGAREDPGDHGFAGTLVGTMGDGRADGTMDVSLGEAGAIRRATFALMLSSCETKQSASGLWAWLWNLGDLWVRMRRAPQRVVGPISTTKRLMQSSRRGIGWRVLTIP